MTTKDSAEAEDYVLELTQEQDIEFAGSSLLAFPTVSKTESP